MAFLAIDVGNAHMTLGVMDDESILMSDSLGTDRRRTKEEYAVLFRNMLLFRGIEPESLEGAIVSSVVPPLRETIPEAIRMITGKRCMIVGPGLKNGLKIRIDDPAQLGSNSVANAVAAVALYPLPALVFDLGIATTVSVVGTGAEYRGGLLMPGVEVGLEAMISQASLLSHVSLSEGPHTLIGTNTNDCISSGVIHGAAAMLDGIADRLREEIGENVHLIMTGRIAPQILPFCREPFVYEKDLRLKGLRIIYKKNTK